MAENSCCIISGGPKCYLLLGKIARFTLRVYSGQTLPDILREILQFFRSVGGKELGVGLQQGSGVFSEVIFKTVSRSYTV